jgi:hypothetical protein
MELQCGCSWGFPGLLGLILELKISGAKTVIV